MELGGNAPFIVFDDADIDLTVEGAMLSKFRIAGQTCVCANRIYVQEGIYEQFAEKLASAAAALRLGNGVDADVTQGPMIDESAVRKVEEHISEALDTAWRASTPLRSPMRWPRSVATSNPVLAAKVHAMASRIISRSSTCAWVASTAEAARGPCLLGPWPSLQARSVRRAAGAPAACMPGNIGPRRSTVA